MPSASSASSCMTATLSASFGAWGTIFGFSLASRAALPQSEPSNPHTSRYLEAVETGKGWSGFAGASAVAAGLGVFALMMAPGIRQLSKRRVPTRYTLLLADTVPTSTVLYSMRTHLCTGARIHARARASMHVHAHPCMCTRIHALAHNSMLACAHTCTRARIHALARAPMHWRAHPCTLARIHARTHACAPTLACTHMQAAVRMHDVEHMTMVTKSSTAGPSHVTEAGGGREDLEANP
eukprot:300864-Chlamydomonas_euryale.AAC.2